jgi:hypothetical protein
MHQSEARYWIAINGSSCAISSFPLRNPMVTPTPEQLFGFPTLEEAQEAQRICLYAPIEQANAFIQSLARDVKSGRVRYIRPEHPQPPVGESEFLGRTVWGTTTWTDSAEMHATVQKAHIKHTAN